MRPRTLSLFLPCVLSLLALAGPARAELALEGVTFRAGETRLERPERVFSAGELIWIAFTVVGFGHDERIWLEQDLEVRGPDGSVVYSQDRASRFKAGWDPELTEAFIQNQVRLSANSPKGRYTAVIELHDRVTGERKAFRERFRLGSTRIKVEAQEGGELTVREPVLLSGPGGGVRPDNVYHPGDKIFLRFQVGGAAVSPRRLVWLEQDLELLGPDGARVLMRRNISGVKQRVRVQVDWITLDNRFKLRRGLATGAYRLVIHLRDRVAGSGAMAWREIYVRPR